MKKILVWIIGIPLAIGLLYGASFVFEIILNLFFIQEMASTILPSWLTYIFDIVAAIVAVSVFHFNRNGKRFEIATTIITLILTVIASHIAIYSWLYFTILCLALVGVCLKLIWTLMDCKPIQKEN